MSAHVLRYRQPDAAPDQPILVVDDMADNCQIVRRRLEMHGYSVICATSGARALEMLAEQPVSVVLLDAMMPTMDGYQVLAALGRLMGDAMPPVIMLTARDAPGEIARAIELGAADYVTKPFDLQVLEARIKGQLKRARSAGALRSRTREPQARLHSPHDRQSLDPLTGLADIRSFESELCSALATARGGSDPGHVLCVCVLDELQAINHTYGPSTGDALLRTVAQALRELVAEGDALARLRGDRFGILFSGRSLDEAHAAAEGIVRTLASLSVEAEGEMLTISVSIGLTQVGADNASVLALIQAAEYAGKLTRGEGSNPIRLLRGGDAQLDDIRANIRWATKLKRALREDALALFAQPIVARGFEHAAPRRYEVLVRMIDENQPVSPGLFLTAIDNHGLATDLDRWVVDRTLDHLGALPASVRSAVDRVSINLSGQSLGSRRFRDHVVERVRHSPVDTSLIGFEVAETAAVAHMDNAVSLIRSLQELGVTFALDDFGAGVSSFGYLRSLPVNTLKVDGRFVRNLASSALDRGIVTAINQVAHVMGMETVAEFVEDELSVQQLDRIGIDYLQGDHLGRPQPLDHYLSAAGPATDPATAQGGPSTAP